MYRPSIYHSVTLFFQAFLNVRLPSYDLSQFSKRKGKLLKLLMTCNFKHATAYMESSLSEWIKRWHVKKWPFNSEKLQTDAKYIYCRTWKEQEYEWLEQERLDHKLTKFSSCSRFDSLLILAEADILDLPIKNFRQYLTFPIYLNSHQRTVNTIEIISTPDGGQYPGNILAPLLPDIFWRFGDVCSFRWRNLLLQLWNVPWSKVKLFDYLKADDVYLWGSSVIIFRHLLRTL